MMRMNGSLGFTFFGFPLIFLGMASLFARVSVPLGYALIVAGALSLGFAVSRGKHRFRLPWAEGAGLLVAGLVAMGLGAPGWLAWGMLAVGLAYLAYGAAHYVVGHPALMRHPLAHPLDTWRMRHRARA